MKNTVTEMRNTLEKIISTSDETEEQISDLKIKVAESTQTEQQKEKKYIKNESWCFQTAITRKQIHCANI